MEETETTSKMKEREDEEDERKEMNRKEKRKTMKKLKRKQMRKETAVKERAEEEARLNNPEEQRRMQLLEQQEAERMVRDRILFEEREMALIVRLESQQQQQSTDTTLSPSPQRNLLEESESAPNDDDDQWEYVEEGPPEIIWQGNDIIFKRNRVRVRVSDKQPNQHQHLLLDADDKRPTSNPFPPESHTDSSTQQALENFAQQVPNFGTEQDKAHCPFHLKTGACRFGQRCSRVHFYPDKSCTLVMKNMYNGPGLTWEQDEGLEVKKTNKQKEIQFKRFIARLILLEAYGFGPSWSKLKYTDEEVECCFEEFYEDVHTEFLKFGEIVNFKVCKNGSFHLRGNVYVQYKFLDSALLAYNSVNGRYFAGKQVSCNFVNLTRWKVAICGEYMKSGFQTCSHGTACNFIHCFRNPGGDYEWADSDRPPPKYWVEKMAALFGYSDDYEALRDRENLSVQKSTSKMSKTDSDWYQSRSRELDQLSNFSGRRKHGDERKQRTPEGEWNANLKDNHKMKRKTPDRDLWEKDEDRGKQHKRTRKNSLHSDKDDNSRSQDKDFHMDWATTTRENEIEHGREPRNTRKGNMDSRGYIYEAESDGDRKRHHTSRRKRSRHQSRDTRSGETESNTKLFERGHLESRNCSRKSLRRRKSGLQDDNKVRD